MVRPEYLFSTYSIVARDPETGQLGVAVQTHQPAVGWIVPWLDSGVGAVATQASVNPSFGPLGLSLLREGISPERVVAALCSSDDGADRRQLAVVDAEGRAAAHTGSNCIAEAGHRTGDGFSVQANMMLKSTVVDAMFDGFSNADGDLAGRMVAALEAAQNEDGDIRGMQSAALVVVPGFDSPYVDEAGTTTNRVRSWERVYDLRVDEHQSPLEELGRLVQIRAAGLRNSEGHRLLDDGKLAEALSIFAEARRMAPDQEEPAFWQAVALLESDAGDEARSRAQEIAREALEGEITAHWLDLAERLLACGMVKKRRTVESLQAAFA